MEMVRMVGEEAQAMRDIATFSRRRRQAVSICPQDGLVGPHRRVKALDRETRLLYALSLTPHPPTTSLDASLIKSGPL